MTVTVEGLGRGAVVVYVDGVRVPELRQEIDASNGYRFVGAWQGGVLKVDYVHADMDRKFAQTSREIEYLRDVIADEDLQYFPTLLDYGLTDLGTAWMLTTLEDIDTDGNETFDLANSETFDRLKEQYEFKDLYINTYLVGSHGAGQRTDGTLVIWDFGQGYPDKVAPKAMHA